MQIAEVGREIDEREEGIDESPLTTDALVASTLTVQWLSAHRKSLDDHNDGRVRDAFEIASWDCLLPVRHTPERRSLEGPSRTLSSSPAARRAPAP